MCNNILNLIKEIKRGSPKKSTLVQMFVSIACKYPEFGHGQHDQNEFLNIVFSTLHDCLSVPLTMQIIQNTNLTPNDKLELKSFNNLRMEGSIVHGTNSVRTDNDILLNSPIYQHFTGQLLARTKCANKNCGYISSTFDIFRTLEVAINQSCLTLEDCLAKFTKTTKLSAEDAYECDKCKTKNESSIKRQLWKTPDVLVICLKRFKATNVNNQWTIIKKQQTITIPDVLDIKPYVCVDRDIVTKYNLVSVAYHIGQMGDGHCYSSIKKDNTTWYRFNDEDVQEIPHPSDKNAYMLFYRRQGSS